MKAIINPQLKYRFLSFATAVSIALILTLFPFRSSARADTTGAAEELQFAVDSSHIDPRIPQESLVERLTEEKEFAYLHAVPEDGSWWTHFWIWLSRLLSRMTGTGEELTFWGVLLTRVLPWTIALTALILIIFKLLGVNPDSFLRKASASPALVFQDKAGTIHEEDFVKMREDAIREGNYRLAIRLYYLETLRHLSGADLIAWHPEKTNHEYYRELGSSELKERFGRLTRLFEFVWYGEMDPGAREFDLARTEFLALKSAINKTAK